MTLTLKTLNQFFCMTHYLMTIQHHTKSGTKIVQRFRRYCVDMIGHTEGMTDGQWTDRVIPIYPHPYLWGGWGGHRDFVKLTIMSVILPNCMLLVTENIFLYSCRYNNNFCKYEEFRKDLQTLGIT